MDEKLKSFYKGFRLNKDVLNMIDCIIHRERLRKVHKQFKKVLRDTVLLPYERYQDSLLIKKRAKLFNNGKFEYVNSIWERVPLYQIMYNSPNFIVTDNVFSFQDGLGYFYVWKESKKILIRKPFIRDNENAKDFTKQEMYAYMWSFFKNYYHTNQIYGMDNVNEALGQQW